MVLSTAFWRILQLNGYMGYAELPRSNSPEMPEHIVGLFSGGQVCCDMGTEHFVATGDGPGMDVVDAGDPLYLFQTSTQALQVQACRRPFHQDVQHLPQKTPGAK
jgi:hypothetical protein